MIALFVGWVSVGAISTLLARWGAALGHRRWSPTTIETIVLVLGGPVMAISAAIFVWRSRPPST